MIFLFFLTDTLKSFVELREMARVRDSGTTILATYLTSNSISSVPLRPYLLAGARDLLYGMLRIDRKKRFTIPEIIHHLFFASAK